MTGVCIDNTKGRTGEDYKSGIKGRFGRRLYGEYGEGNISSTRRRLGCFSIDNTNGRSSGIKSRVGGVSIDSIKERSREGYISCIKRRLGGVSIDSTEGRSGEGYITGT